MTSADASVATGIRNERQCQPAAWWVQYVLPYTELGGVRSREREAKVAGTSL